MTDNLRPIIEYTVNNENAIAPNRKHSDDAGADLSSCEEVLIPAGEHRLVGTGVHASFPENVVAFITPRSGLAGKSGITVLNAPGTVDAGYKGELKVILINHSKVDYTVNIGDRIGQLVVQPVLFPTFKKVSEFSEDGDTKVSDTRGQGGFGSTGV